MKLFSALFICPGLFVSANAQDATAPLTLDKTIPLEKVEGRIDHMAADISGQRLFVTALGNNTVEVLDLKAGKIIQSLPDFAEPQGIAYVPELDRVFGNVGDALRFGEVRKALDDLACFQVEDFDRVVSEGGDEEPLPRDIGGHVVNSPLDLFEGNRFIEREGGGCV